MKPKNNSKHNNSKYLFLYDNDIKKERSSHIVLVVERRKVKKSYFSYSHLSRKKAFSYPIVECFYFEQLLLIHHKLMELYTNTTKQIYIRPHTHKRAHSRVENAVEL